MKSIPMDQFSHFAAEHRDRALGLAWRLLGGDRAAAEDVVQEAFVRAHRSLDRFRGDARLSTWFYRILVNEAQRHRRWAWLRDPLRSGGAERALEIPSGSEPGDPVLRARIAKALDQLPRRQREVFVLVHLEGFTLREVAGITRLAVGTVKSHLHRALVSLRRELAELDPSASTSVVTAPLAELEGLS